MAEIAIFKARSLAGTTHGFLGRVGGVSTGVAAGLNVGLGSDDEPSAVAENRRMAAEAVLPGASLASLAQVHSAKAVIVTKPWEIADRPEADALVTDRPGLLLGIVTADCAPVLFADSSANIVGAAHAGWRGAHDGIIESTLAAMEQLGAKRQDITAAIGPCIAQASYEVDDAFRDKFGDSDSEFFSCGRAGYWQFDLAGFVAKQLRTGGVKTIESMNLDTYANEDRFFSYRRGTHRGEADYGRQFSLIGLS